MELVFVLTGLFNPSISLIGILITFILAIIIYAISNYRLGDLFNKGIVFKIGLILLPFIFKPILAFQRNK